MTNSVKTRKNGPHQKIFENSIERGRGVRKDRRRREGEIETCTGEKMVK